MKKKGFGKELEIGDPSFDNQVYVYGDHPLIRRFLVNKTQTRQVILEILATYVREIEISDNVLTLHIRDEMPTSAMDGLLEALAHLAEQLQNLPLDVRPGSIDEFKDVKLIIQSVAFSLAAYGLYSLLHLADRAPFLKVFPYRGDYNILWLSGYGLLSGVGIAVLLVLSIRRFLG